jgi:hypothetical protein
MQEAVPNQPVLGFDQPITPDDWVARQYEQHGLGPTPSLADVELIATRLLGDARTALAGLELVLGRRMDASSMATDEKLRPFLRVIMSGVSPEEKFGALLMMLPREPEAET